MERRDRLIQQKQHDPYRAAEKLRDPTVCPECSAVFRDGRWCWAQGPEDAPRVLCPACQRARDGYPAGFLRIQGEFPTEHRAEIIGLCRNTEAEETKEHPMNRILELIEERDGLLITTATVHLARTLGEALHSAYRGQLDIDYAEDVARIRWHR